MNPKRPDFWNVNLWRAQNNPEKLSEHVADLASEGGEKLVEHTRSAQPPNYRYQTGSSNL
jgi:hypothetical protein